MRGAVLALCLALPGAASAQELDFDARLIQSCLDRGQGRACIGVAAEACMAATPGGFSTVGMGGCTRAEEDWWDAQLNAAYQTLRARERAADADWRPIPGMAPRPSGADVLRDMQRAWIGWRDATCLYEEFQWWGGTGASLAGAACRMRLTGEQALTLRGYLADG
jgi:uncharacterized protein YecT (DUF1311 family)